MSNSICGPSKDLNHVTAFLRTEEMDQAQSYLERGRELRRLCDADLKEIWVAAFERWFESRSTRTGRNMDDVAAEIRLRGLEMPYDRVRSKIDRLRKKLEHYDRKTVEKMTKAVWELSAARSKLQP